MSNDLQGALFVIGNPLLDISANVPQDFLEKYELKTGNAILADPQKHLPLYGDLVKNFPVEYIAGGAAQNSARACQWMIQSPSATSYVGCVGNDENAKHIKDAAESYGVKTHYMIDNSKPTGTCAVLVRDKERSLVANLAAAESYRKTHFDTPEIQSLVKNAKYFYATGFFLTHDGFDTLLAIGEHAKQTDKHFLFNLSAPFLIQFFWERMKLVLPFTDVVFCNEDEAAELGKKQGWGTDLAEIAQKLANFPKENNSRKRMVVFTQGAKETIVYQNDQVHRFTPIPCKPEDIVDTNGAGDSFVGGFLSQYIQQKPLQDCIDAAHYAAWECIRRSGATFPSKPNWKK
jgi:adenosine kinase